MDETSDEDRSFEEIKKEKPIVKSLTNEDPDNPDPETDKPDLPPAMPPVV